MFSSSLSFFPLSSCFFFLSLYIHALVFCALYPEFLQLLAMEPEVNVFVIMVEAHNRNQLRRLSEEASSDEVVAPHSLTWNQLYRVVVVPSSV